MMDLSLTLTTSPDEQLDASAALMARGTRLKARLIILGAVFPLALAFGLGIATLLGYPLVAATIVALYTVIGGLIGLGVALRWQARRIRTIFASSSLLQREKPVSLSEGGVRFDARQFPWTAITDQSRWNEATLLHFSTLDALVIPDRDLPAGLSPEDLQAQVAKWLRR